MNGSRPKLPELYSFYFPPCKLSLYKWLWGVTTKCLHYSESKWCFQCSSCSVLYQPGETRHRKQVLLSSTIMVSLTSEEATVLNKASVRNKRACDGLCHSLPVFPMLPVQLVHWCPEIKLYSNIYHPRHFGCLS